MARFSLFLLSGGVPMMSEMAVPIVLLCLALLVVAALGWVVNRAACRRGFPLSLRLAQVTTVVTLLMFFVLCAVPELGLATLLPTLVGVGLVLVDLVLFIVAACATVFLGHKFETDHSVRI